MKQRKRGGGRGGERRGKTGKEGELERQGARESDGRGMEEGVRRRVW